MEHAYSNNAAYQFSLSKIIETFLCTMNAFNTLILLVLKTTAQQVNFWFLHFVKPKPTLVTAASANKLRLIN